MLTIKCQKNIEVAKKYFEEHLTKDEYYSNSTVSPGRWIGTLASKMGLDKDSPITAEQFDLLVDGKNPSTQKSLTQRLSQNRRVFFDATFSAPKSVSIMGLVGKDSRLLKAHNQAVEHAFLELEQLAQTRVRVDGQYTDRYTSSLLGAKFLHTTSRENDPQLHTHLVIFNATYDETENKFKALQARQIYDQSRLLTEVYRQKLAFLCRKLGYEIQKVEHGFEIKGVSKDLLDLYSKRSKGMKGVIFEQEKELGRRLTNNEKAIVAQQTRRSKDKTQTLDEIIDFQNSQLTAEQRITIGNLALESKNKEKSLLKTPDKPALVNLCIDKAILHCFERRSVVNTADLAETVLKQNYGHDISKKDVINQLKTRPELIFDDTMSRVGTKKELAREEDMINIINSSKLTSYPLNDAVVTSPLLGSDQNKALLGVMKSTDQFIAIRGAAGSGKSKLISKIVENINKDHVIALAPTTSAKNSLISDYKVSASTVQAFTKSKFNPDCKILIVDEAGLLSNEDMHKVITRAKKQDLKVILVGDTLQHHSVRAGDSLRIIEKYSEIQSFKLSHIYRQNSKKYLKKHFELKKQDPIQAEIYKEKAKKTYMYKKAVKSLVLHQNAERSWDYLEKMNSIKEIDDKTARMTRFSKEYVQNIKNKEDIIAITPTWKSINELTANIRIELKEQGLISKADVELETKSSMKLTDSEKLNFSDKVIGRKTFVCFFEQTDLFKPGIDYEVFIDKKDNIYLKEPEVEDKQIFHPDILNVSKFDVLEGKKISISEREKLLIQGNFKSEDRFFYNGENVNVKEVKNGSILLEDGRVFDPKKAKFDYGYVSTSISAQGRTHEKSMVHLTSEDGKSLSLNQYYVSISRGRSDISLYVDDTIEVKDRIKELSLRDSCLELLRNSKPLEVKKDAIKQPIREQLVQEIDVKQILKSKEISRDYDLERY